MEIKDIMSKHLIVGKYNDSISTISSLMNKYDIGFIPIIKDNHVIGVITDRDIVIRALPSNQKKITNCISPNIINCEIDKSIDELVDIMKKSKIKRILITELEKVIGIVSISDIPSEKQIDLIKEIYSLNKSNFNYDTEIDEFYL